MNKCEKLIKIAFKSGSVISDSIDLYHFKRLIDGDLSHIGDAIIAGKEIMYKGRVDAEYRFLDSAKFYSVKPSTKKVFGVNIEMFSEGDLKKEITKGFKVYYSLYSAKYKISEILQYLHPRDPEANVVIFKNKSDAEAVAKAMNKLAGIEL